MARFGEKLLDDALGFSVVAFAEMMVTPASLGIDEIMRGPIFIVEGAPDGVLAVDGDRVADLQI